MMKKGKLYKVLMDFALKMERKFSNVKLGDITAVHDGERLRLYIPEVPIPKGSFILFISDESRGLRVLFLDMVGWIDRSQFSYAGDPLSAFKELEDPERTG